jgi:hypothetical protein
MTCLEAGILFKCKPDQDPPVPPSASFQLCKACSSPFLPTRDGLFRRQSLKAVVHNVVMSLITLHDGGVPRVTMSVLVLIRVSTVFWRFETKFLMCQGNGLKACWILFCEHDEQDFL